MAALLLTGKPAIPSLVAMFRDDPHNPGYPLVFSFFGPDAKEALPLVLQSLEDKDDRVRIASVLALRSFGDSSPEVIASLRAVALKDKSPKASSLAMEAMKYLLLPKKLQRLPAAERDDSLPDCSCLSLCQAVESMLKARVPCSCSLPSLVAGSPLIVGESGARPCSDVSRCIVSLCRPIAPAERSRPSPDERPLSRPFMSGFENVGAACKAAPYR